jgi:hypothetical protein
LPGVVKFGKVKWNRGSFVRLVLREHASTDDKNIFIWNMVQCKKYYLLIYYRVIDSNI